MTRPRLGSRAVLWLVSSLGGCLSLPEAQPCTSDANCEAGERCDVAAGRCVAGGAGGGGGAGGRSDATGAPVGGEIAGGADGGADAGPAGGGVAGGADAGGGASPPSREVWAQVSAGGGSLEVPATRGFASLAGGAHTCAVTSSGRLFCFGSNADGQLGVGQTPPRSATPLEVSPGTRWAAVSAGLSHTCGVRAADDPDVPGGLFCWGRAEFGRLGAFADLVGGTSVPLRVGRDSDWTHVSAGGGHTCAIRGAEADAQLFCFGDNQYGQAGGEGSEVSGVEGELPPPLPGTGWTRISAGLAHTCGVRAGEVLCMGANDLGECGQPPGEICRLGGTCLQTPTAVNLGSVAVDVSAGDSHTCALDETGVAFCWGANYDGELGPTFVDSFTFEATASGTGLDALDAGGVNTCKRGSGRLVCRGRGRQGERGNGFPDTDDGLNADVPVVAAPRGMWTTVSVGGQHACALTDLGELGCWGSRFDGQLGTGGFSGTLEPTRVALPGRALQLSAAYEDSICAIVASADAPAEATTGDVYCWGDGTRGLLLQLAGPKTGSPLRLTLTGDYRALAVGERFACAVRDPDEVLCWGQADRGQVGDTGEQPGAAALTPVDLGSPAEPVVSLVAGAVHACAVVGTPGSLTARCWGQNGEGQLGPATSGRGPHAPAPLNAVADAQGLNVVALGANRTFALADDGSLVQWGGMRDLHGGAFQAEAGVLSQARALDSGTDWLDVAAGWDRVCGIRAGSEGKNRLLCGDLVALDVRPEDAEPEPLVEHTPSRRWTSMAVANNMVCALDFQGMAYCTGDNLYGQLGDRTRFSRQPAQMLLVRAGGVQFKQLAAGTGFVCGIARQQSPGDDHDGALYCWGRGDRGQNGQGVTDATTPVLLPPPDALAEGDSR